MKAEQPLRCATPAVRLPEVRGRRLSGLVRCWVVLLVSSWVGTLACQGQGTREDSLLKVLRALPPGDMARTELLYALSEMNWFTHPGRGLKYAQEALTITEETLKLVATPKERKGLKASKLRARNDAGFCCYQLGNYPSAIEHYQQVYQLSKEVEYPGGMVAALINLSDVYIALKEYPDALRYLKQVVAMDKRLSNHLKDQYLEPNTLSTMGQVYLHLDSLGKAMACFQGARQRYETIGAYDFLYEAYVGIAEVHQRQGRRKEAIGWIQRGLSTYRDTTGSPIGESKKAKTLIKLARIYHEDRQYRQAIGYALEAKRLAHSSDAIETVMSAHQLLAEVYETQGDLPLALRHQKQFKALSDSIFTQAKSHQVSEMQTVFETTQKEEQIRTLRQQNQVKTLQAARQRSTNQALIGGALLSSLLAGVLFNRYRFKQRVNQRLRGQQAEINQKNQTLEHLLGEQDQLLTQKDGLLAEKELLMKEIHHRVKNNLMIVESLLEAQIDRTDNAKVLLALLESRSRVQTIALIHQFLYRSRNATQLQLQPYVETLVEQLSQAMGCSGRIAFRLDVAAIDLDADVAIPLGLILNETLTNACKYAFPGSATGSVRISLRTPAPQALQLEVADDGIGLPEDFDLSQSLSLGMRLVVGLVNQLGAAVSFTNEPGCVCRLSIPLLRPVYPSPANQSLTYA